VDPSGLAAEAALNGAANAASSLINSNYVSGSLQSLGQIPSGLAQLGSDFLTNPAGTARSLGPSFGGLGGVVGQLPGAVTGAIGAIQTLGAAPAAETQGNPFGIPESFTSQSSQKGGGTVYVDPANPSYNRVRVMPGNPNSPNPAQQNPYVIDLRNGQAIDVNGNQLPSTSDPAAHIPQSQYQYRP
jgi:hypothetical protein